MCFFADFWGLIVAAFDTEGFRYSGSVMSGSLRQRSARVAEVLEATTYFPNKFPSLILVN